MHLLQFSYLEHLISRVISRNTGIAESCELAYIHSVVQRTTPQTNPAIVAGLLLTTDLFGWKRELAASK